MRISRSSTRGYELLQEIGRGGMGVVYRARDESMEREVAVKVLSRRFAPDGRMAGRFIAEAKITGRLQHPGVPAVYDIGRMSDGRPFHAMKLIEGDTLEALLASGEPLDRLAVFEAVAQTVGYAHAHGVVHRDLKPQNVMVSSFGEVQVMDWGLAKVSPKERDPITPVDDSTATPVFNQDPNANQDDSDSENNSIFGTPAYMAPEQASGEANKVDRRSDVFGLGAILCAILTGKGPLRGGDLESIRRAAVNTETVEAFALLATCGSEPDVVNLCKRCLSPRPADRPRDAAAVAVEVTWLRAVAANRARQAERALVRAEQSKRTGSPTAPHEMRCNGAVRRARWDGVGTHGGTPRAGQRLESAARGGDQRAHDG